MSDRKKWLLPLIVCLALAGLTLAAYWPVRNHEFIGLDDPDYVTENPEIKAGLTAHSIHWAFTESFSSNWHPLTWMSHMLDCQLFGLNPKGPHLENVTWHIANSLLILLFLSKTTGAFWRSAFVAALFALHPVHVESVAWVSERKDMLSTFFGLSCLLAYTAYAKRSSSPPSTIHHPSSTNPSSIIFYLLSLVLFSLGLMSKAMLVTWPFLLLVLDFWPLRRFPSSPPAFFAFFRGYSPLRLIHQSTNPPIHHPSSLPRLLLEKLPFLALSVTSCLVTMWAQKGAISSFETFPVSFRFINAPRAWVGYLGKLCWPTNLSVFYRFPDNLTFSMAILPLLLLLAITLAAWFLRKSRPYFFSGWLWYLGTLVPVIGIIQVGSQSMADRYTYIPSIGLFFAVAWLVADLLSKRPIPSPSTREEQVGRGLGRGAAHINLSIHQSTNPSSSLEPATSNLQPSPSPSPSSIIHHPSSLPLALAAAAILALCATLTFQQAKVWRTSRTLFEHARKVTDRNFLAATVLGRLLQNEGKPAEALESFRLATQYAPLFPSGWYGMGTTLYALGKPQEGDQAFEQALRLNPEDLEGLDTYGLALLNTKRFVQAEPVFVKVLDLRPNYAEGHLHLALALQGQDKIAEALPHFQQAVALKPEGFEVHYAYAQLLGTQKRFPEAIAQYQAALQIQPNSLDSHLGLGAALVETGGWEKAAEQFSTVLAASPTNSSALDGLGYTLAMRGKFEEALLYFVKAAEAAPSNSFPHLHLAMEYERRKDIPKAIEQLRLAVQCSPGMTAALNDLAWILATNPDPKFRDGAEAVRMAEQACKNTKDSEPLFMGTLAAAYAEAGRFDDAIRTAEKARDLAKSMGLNEVVRRNEELLPLYRAHKPYHEPK